MDNLNEENKVEVESNQNESQKFDEVKKDDTKNKDESLKIEMTKTEPKKKGSIVWTCIFSLVVMMMISIIVLEITLPKTNSFRKWVKKNVWDVEGFTDWFENHMSTMIGCLITIIIVLGITKLIRYIFRQRLKKSNRAKTVITLLDGIIKYLCAIVVFIYILKACGVNTTALIASVGVITLIIGIGAQSLIADIIAGLFIVFENEYNVGEIISIDGFRGQVVEIGIRSTKLLDISGNIKIVNNSDISSVVNMSRELSVASVDCEFGYDVPVEKIENLLKVNLPLWKDKIDGIIEGPYYKGVSYYGDSNVGIKIVAKCKEDNRYQIQRDLMREYRSMILKEGIDISYTQVVLNEAVKSDKSLTKKEQKSADKFVQEQKEASEAVDILEQEL